MARFIWIAVAALIFLTLPSSMSAQDLGVLNPDTNGFLEPHEGCGSNDPTTGDGEPGGSTYECEICFEFPEGPSGEPAFWACVDGDPLREKTYIDCKIVDGFCERETICQVA